MDPLELARAGLSDREIERRTGIPRRRVARLRDAAGLPAWRAPLPEHGTPARGRRGCDCDRCKVAARAAKRRSYEQQGPVPAQMTAERSAELVARSQRIQAETAAGATNARARWSTEDLAIALDYRHTAGEAAALLNRSLSSVRHVRRKRRARPDVLPHRPRTDP